MTYLEKIMSAINLRSELEQARGKDAAKDFFRSSAQVASVVTASALNLVYQDGSLPDDFVLIRAAVFLDEQKTSNPKSILYLGAEASIDKLISESAKKEGVEL